MALSSTMIQPVNQPNGNQPVANHNVTAPLLSMLVLSVYAAQKSKKSFRKLKRQFMWTAFKLKAKSFFSNPKRAGSVSDRTLIYILLGVVLLALLFIEPVLALVLALLALILILVGAI
jgi:hypothetical protein